MYPVVLLLISPQATPVTIRAGNNITAIVELSWPFQDTLWAPAPTKQSMRRVSFSSLQIHDLS